MFLIKDTFSYELKVWFRVVEDQECDRTLSPLHGQMRNSTSPPPLFVSAVATRLLNPALRRIRAVLLLILLFGQWTFAGSVSAIRVRANLASVLVGVKPRLPHLVAILTETLVAILAEALVAILVEALVAILVARPIAEFLDKLLIPA